MLDRSKRYFAGTSPDKKSNKTTAYHERPNQNKVIKF